MRRELLPDVCVLVLAAVITRPMLFVSGYGLARDMVFTPRQPLTTASLGLGSGAARAAPLDALLGLTGQLVDGTWVGRLAVLGVLALAGCGAHRLVGAWSLPARLLTATLAVWNPFVIERLALGQWALLASYAALPWLAAALIRLSTARWSYRAVAPVVAWLGLASITPTGGLVGAATTMVFGIGRDRRQAGLLVAVAALTQLPWVLPSLLNTASVTSDPAAVSAFAARAERPGGPLLSLIGLGGIWDAGSVPSSRSGPLGYLTTIVAVAALLIGFPRLARTLGAGGRRRLAWLAGVGLLLAAASSVPGSRTIVRWLVDTVPGAGLFRDAQKWLIPFALLVVLCCGAVADRVYTAARSRADVVSVPIAVLAVMLPVLLLPDALGATRNTLTPARYPSDFARVARVVNGHGAVLTVPIGAYRRFGWGRPVAVADPAPQWFDTRVVVSDELVVGRTKLAGEDPVVARISRDLASGRTIEQAAADASIRWLVVYRDASGIPPLSQLAPTYVGGHLAVYRVPGGAGRTAETASSAAVAIVVAVDVVALALVVMSLLVALARAPWYAVAALVRSRSPILEE
jgi:hypothetical protein